MAARTNKAVADLRKRAVTVKLTSQMFGIERKDEKATAAIIDQFDCSEEAAKGIKFLINPKNPLFKKIAKVKGLARNTHIEITAPWEDEGFRIISAQKYPAYIQTMDELIAEFNKAVNIFVKAWADIVEEAREKNGDLFDEHDYPTAKEVKAMFKLEVETKVLPDNADIRLELDAARVAKIQREAVETDKARIAEVSRFAHEQVSTELQKMIKALKEFGDDIEGTKRSRTFRDTLVERMASLADTLPNFNIAGDPKLDKLAKKIAADLTTFDAAELRGDRVKGDKKKPEQRAAESATKRDKVQESAEDMLDALGSYTGQGSK